MQLGERKKRIVTAVVDAYIRTGEPIGSKLLAEMMNHAVSSATIRNEMADLASAGYLAQPHTSAGRVPTAAAFRLYLDQLLAQCSLSEESQHAIDEELLSVSADPERLLGRASELLVDATGVAVAVASTDRRGACMRRVEIIATGSQSAAVLLMTDAGALHSRVCRLDRVYEPQIMEQLTACLNREFGGRLLVDVGIASVQALLPQLDGGLLYLPLLTAFVELVREASEGEVRLSGQLNLLHHPDYPADRARSLLTFLSQRQLLEELLMARPNGLRVMLGSESTRRELDGSSIIVTRYGSEGSGGSLCLIGPVRMDYAQAIPHLQYVASTVSQMLAQLTGKQ